MWPEKTVVIIGGGPSLKDFNRDRLRILKAEKGLRIIGVNDAYEWGSWVDMCFYGDNGWLVTHVRKGDILDYPGLVITNTEYAVIPNWVLRLKRIPLGLTDKKWMCAWNHNSGISAINLACLLGARRIVLIGFDMKIADGKAQWHEDHRGFPPNPNSYPKFMKGAEALAARLPKLFPGVEVINATPGSAMNTFPIMSLKKALHA